MQSSSKTGHSSSNAAMRVHRPRRTKSPRMSPVLEDAKVGGQTEAVILRIIEDTNTIIPSQATHIEQNFSNNTASREDKIFVFPQPQRRVSPSPSSMSRSTMSRSPESQSPNSRLNGNSQHKFAVFPPPRSSTPSRSKSTTSSSRKRAKTVNSTNSQGDSAAWSSPSTSESEPREIGNSQGQYTPSHPPPPPPPPMRSIFPRYDHELPLNQQKYYPNAGSPRSSSDQPPSRVDYGYLSPLANSACAESSFSSNDGTVIASVESLEKLWVATCGENPGFDTSAFHLNIRRIDSFTYNIGAGSVPFYTLKTDTISDFELHKTHPTKPNTKSPIVTLSLDHIENRTSATISIFPKLAEILAREQSLERARQNQLSPAQAMETENEAVSHIRAKETCLFEWQDAQTRYKLHYQAMMNPSPATPGSSPQSARSSVPSCLLNASVSNSLPPFGGPSYGPTIILSVPSSGSSSRNTGTPLVAVDLEHMTLSIFANDILSTVPSLHSIDTLVAAILTVTVSNETTKQVLESIDIYAPKPEEFPDPYRPPTPNPTSILANNATTNSNDNINTNKKPSTLEDRRYFTPTGKQIFTTQAEREEFEQEAELMSQIRQKGKKAKRSQSKSSLTSAWTWPWKKEPEVEEIDLEAGIGRTSNAAAKEQAEGVQIPTTKQQKKRKPALVVEEIDVERYGRYADGTPRAGEKLPGPTRAALRALFWFFSLIMWCLTTCVKGLAWMLVSLTQCVSSKKG